MKDLILKKLKETSTWVGLAGLIAGLTFIPHYLEISQTIAAVGGAVVAVLGIWFPETEIKSGE